jgi:hypothetical protein
MEYAPPGVRLTVRVGPVAGELLPNLIRCWKSPAMARVTKVVVQPQLRRKSLHLNAVEDYERGAPAAVWD